MELNDHSLRQMDEDAVRKLLEPAVRDLAVRLLNDLKEARALRHWMMLRRIYYGTKTPEGSRVFAILASVIETSRKRQHSPWLYLQNVIANRNYSDSHSQIR